MATLDHVSEHLATLDIKSDVQKATSGHLATLAHVERDVQKAMSEHPNTRPVQDPSFTGWINWAAFHLEEPKDTMRMLRGPDVYLAMQYIFARFAVHSLIGRSNVSDGRFQNVTTIVIQLSADRKSFHVTSHFQSDIQNNVHKVGEAFAVQVSLVTVEGLSKTATLWIENNMLEIFNPWELRSPMLGKIITKYVLPLLRRRWIRGDVVLKPVQYALHKDAELMNWWNIYFLFIRSAHKQPIPELFGKNVVLSSLVDKRNVVIQTCGRIIARCAQQRDLSVNSENYERMFGPSAKAFALNRKSVEHDLPNIFARCPLSESALWNAFDELDPDMSAEGRSVAPDHKWAADTDPKWLPFVETTSKVMEFFNPNNKKEIN